MGSNFKGRAIRSLIQGVSILDTPRLELPSKTEAIEFVKGYGLNLDEPSDWSYVQSIYSKAMYFLFEYLLSRKEGSSSLPKRLETPDDLYRLLLQASRDPEVEESKLKSLWSCAILRVCHALFHAEHDWRSRYLNLANDQIIGPIAEHVKKDLNGKKWLGEPLGPTSIALVEFMWRTDKPFESRLAKLILKPQFGNQDIYDRIALRFVTHRKIDTVRVVQYLLDNFVISMAHLLPNRSRNTLFDLDSAILLLDEWDGVDEKALDDLEQRLNAAVPQKVDNVNTSDQYRACHLTLRKIVVDHDDRAGLQRFLLPYEIQIMDAVSFEDSVLGYSSHDRYKIDQHQTVVKRTLGKELASLQGLS